MLKSESEQAVRLDYRANLYSRKALSSKSLTCGIRRKNGVKPSLKLDFCKGRRASQWIETTFKETFCSDAEKTIAIRPAGLWPRACDL
jgi:hypothetical protein